MPGLPVTSATGRWHEGWGVTVVVFVRKNSWIQSLCGRGPTEKGEGANQVFVFPGISACLVD